MSILAQLPEFAVWFAGVALALVHWRRAPRAAPLMLLALLLLITLRLVAGYVNTLLPLLLGGAQGFSAEQLAAAYALSTCVQSAIAAAAWALVLAAVFGNPRRREG